MHVMSQIIIAPFPKDKKKKINDPFQLNVSEFFMDTIQGEGVFTGHPAVFLRLQGCILNCAWCDSKEIWTQGDSYSSKELFYLVDKFALINKFNKGHHLVITGGSPLKQQNTLSVFLHQFILKYGFLPYIEMENECVIKPNRLLGEYVGCWNNSPKLNNSGQNTYHPDVIKYMATFNNSWFKFVINQKEDWEEIERKYIQPNLIKKNQIILMPQGKTKEEIQNNSACVVNLAIKNSVRYCTREHIILWDSEVSK